MGSDIKQFPETVKVKGTGLPGLTATFVKRIDQVAWCIRNDGYHEIFLIKTGLSFDGSSKMEYYPGNSDFNKTAWCIRIADRAGQYFANLRLGIFSKPTKDTISEHIYPLRHPSNIIILYL